MVMMTKLVQDTAEFAEFSLLIIRFGHESLCLP